MEKQPTNPVSLTWSMEGVGAMVVNGVDLSRQVSKDITIHTVGDSGCAPTVVVKFLVLDDLNVNFADGCVRLAPENVEALEALGWTRPEWEVSA